MLTAPVLLDDQAPGPARTSCGSPSSATVAEPARATRRTSRSLVDVLVGPAPGAGQARRVASTSSVSVPQSGPDPSRLEQVDDRRKTKWRGERSRAPPPPLVETMSWIAGKSWRSSSRTWASSSSASPRIDEGSAPSVDLTSASRPAYERVQPLVLEQRLHEQPLPGAAVVADQEREELFLLIAEVPEGLGAEEAEKRGRPPRGAPASVRSRRRGRSLRASTSAW